MTAPAVTDVRRSAGGGCLLGGVVVASLTEAISGTLLALGRSDIMGDIHATPDEFAWLDVAYIAMKLVGFAATPWLLTRVDSHRALLWATVAMGLAGLLAAFASRLDILVALRLVQGLAGAALLVSGQAILFWRFAPREQPFVQAMFAMGAVVAPATLTPVLQGWLIDAHDWTWICLLVLPLAFAAIGLLLIAPPTAVPALGRRAFDAPGFGAVTVTLFAATWFLSQGSRWDWLEHPGVQKVAVLMLVGFLVLVARQPRARMPLLDLKLFRNDDFSFAFVVSFVAGAALFGSTFVIPAFALSVLGMTPTAAGALLLPSGAVFMTTLLAAALLMQSRRIAPIATVPVGIVSVMIAMWMLSGSAAESGSGDMMAALLLRGFGLGCLFLSITLIAFGRLAPEQLAFGIGLFNIGRQLGGLMGVAGLQTLIDHHSAINRTVLGTLLSPGSQAMADRLAQYTGLLMERGMDPGPAAAAARALLIRTLNGQGTVIAFNTAFNAVALLFVAAVPVIVAIKITLARKAREPSAAGLPS